MSSPNDLQNTSFGSFRPHPRSPYQKINSQQSQYPSASEGFQPLSFSSPIINNKYKQRQQQQQQQNQDGDSFNNSSSFGNNYPNKYRNNSRDFRTNYKFQSKDDQSNFFIRPDAKNNGEMYNNYRNRKSFNKMTLLNSYFHYSMLEDPWEELEKEYDRSFESVKDEET